MSTQLIAFTGWGYQKEHFSKIEIPQLKIYAWEDFFREKILINENEIFSSEKSYLLIGWSLGAMLLLPFLNSPNVQGSLLIAGGLSFSKSDQNSYGISAKVIDRMIKQFEKNPAAVLSDFYKRSGTPKMYIPDNNQLKKKDIDLMIKGLIYLKEKIHYLPHSQKPTTILQGLDDAIFNHRGAFTLASQQNAVIKFVPKGNHDLISQFPGLIKNEILALLNRIEQIR